MASSRLAHVIFKFITIAAVVNGNLLTFDGQCPFADMKPLTIDAAEIVRMKYLYLFYLNKNYFNFFEIVNQY